MIKEALGWVKETWDYLSGKPGPTGYGSCSTADEVTVNLSLYSLTAIVTGATSGIGEEIARVLAKRGARVVIASRSINSAWHAKQRILQTCPNAEIIVLHLDLSSFASIRKFTANFLKLGIPLHILINNAGRYGSKLEFSHDGIELTFATNHLGPFLLTNLLLPKMIETVQESKVQGRIVNISSCIHESILRREVNLSQTQRMPPTKVYALSKLANILHAKELSRRLKADGHNITINAVHPGVVKTGLTREFNLYIIELIFVAISMFTKSIPQGAATACYAAVHPDAGGMSGKYLIDCNQSACSSLADDPSLAMDLWNMSALMIANKCSETAVN